MYQTVGITMDSSQTKSPNTKSYLYRYTGYITSAWNSLKYHCLFCYQNRLIPLAVVAALGALSLYLLPITLLSCLGLVGALFLSALYNIKTKLRLCSQIPCIRQELTVINGQLSRYPVDHPLHAIRWISTVCSLVELMSFGRARVGTNQNSPKRESKSAARSEQVDTRQKDAYVGKFTAVLESYNVGNAVNDFFDYARTCYLHSLVPIRLLFVSMLVVLMGLFSFSLYAAAAISGCLSLIGVASNIVCKLAIIKSNSDPLLVGNMLQQIQSSIVTPWDVEYLSLIELVCAQLNLWLFASSRTTFSTNAVSLGGWSLYSGVGASGGGQVNNRGLQGLSSAELTGAERQELVDRYRYLRREIPKAVLAKISPSFMQSRQSNPEQSHP